jgi:fluoroacetyl-CoA thioesterase
VIDERLVPELHGSVETAIDEAMVTGHVAPAVLSTPTLVRLLEEACAGLTRPHLAADRTTVGTKVCVTHQAAAHVGELLTVTGRATGVVRNRVTYDVEARVGERLVSIGSLEQAIVTTPQPAAST